MTIESDVLDQIVTEVNTLFPGRLNRPSDGAVADANAYVGPPAPKKRTGVATTRVAGEALFVTIKGGPPNQPYINEDDGSRLEFPEVLVTIRSEKTKYTTGFELADAAFGAIDRNPPSGYVDARTNESAPRYVQEDEINQYYWEFTVRLTKCVGI